MYKKYINDGDSNFGASMYECIKRAIRLQKYIVEIYRNISVVIREYAFSVDGAVGSRDSPRESSPEGRDAI